ncbi:hypothetical protein LEMLEM_LOCUS13481 [Lemmus lemmus]
MASRSTGSHEEETRETTEDNLPPLELGWMMSLTSDAGLGSWEMKKQSLTTVTGFLLQGIPSA